MAQKMTLDFSNVKDGGSFSPKHKPEGEYLGTITAFEDTKSKAGNAMWVFAVTLKGDRRAVYPVYCTLNSESLWKLRQVLMACGIRVPKKKLSVDGNRLVGKDLGVCLEDDEYEGKKKSVISTFFPASEYEGDDTGESDTDEEEPEEEEYEDDAEQESDEDDSDADDTADDSDEDDTEEGEDDEEDEPEPVKKASPKAAPTRKAPARAKKKAPAKVEEDEDEDEMDVEDL